MDWTPVERAAQDAARLRDARLSAPERRRGGVVHTPPELARFVARAADELVRAELEIASGLADPSIALIDPACGPGAFLAAAVAVAGERSSAPNAVFGMDADPRAIEAAHAALGPALLDAGWTARLEVRDTLFEVRPEAAARLAAVPVVLGNPPWVASAQARPTAWLDALLEDFRRDADGVRLEERKLGVLADAYVRFLRWACEVARSGARGAVVAFVTNASYLDGPVHRGIRAALRRYFDALYVLDLGGSALLARAGERDDNVFGVRPSAAVLLAVRRPDATEDRLARVQYARLRGPLECKLDHLCRAGLGDAGFQPLSIAPSQHRFVPTVAAREDYASWPSLAAAMPFHREGVQTNRDAVAIDFNRARLLARLRAFAAGALLPELAPALARLPHYDPVIARAAVARALAADPDARGTGVVRAIAYRPLDTRWFAPIAPLCHRPRPRLLAAMERSRFALISVRKDRGSAPWLHFGAARDAIDNCWLSSRSSCRARAFPTHDQDGRENFDPAIAAAFGERVGRAISSVDFACYALAVLASAEYRARHAGALAVDYPRIPPPRDAAHFEKWCREGAQLLSLLCDPLPHDPGADAVAGPVGRAPKLELDQARGELRLSGELVCRPGVDSFAATLGHRRLLHELARGSSARAAGAVFLRAASERTAAIFQRMAAIDALG